MEASDVIVTDGATAVELTSHERSALRMSGWPAVSTAMACIVHLPSNGTVNSCDHVALVAPMTSGSPRKVL